MAQNIVFFDNCNNEHNSANSVALNNYLTSLSKPELKKLISDPHWNSYPEYVYYKSMNTRNSTTHNPKDYFRIINPAINPTLLMVSEIRCLPSAMNVADDVFLPTFIKYLPIK